jgi:hypothetical protein
MFARHFEARHRSGAVVRARNTAARLKDTGDVSGSVVWNEVAQTIQRLRDDQRHIARRRDREKV